MDIFSAFINGEANRGREMKVFDWEKAARLIKEHKPEVAYAGLIEDWNATADTIWEEGKPNTRGWGYLASTWATPTLEMDDVIHRCYRMESETPGWGANTNWPPEALAIIGD